MDALTAAKRFPRAVIAGLSTAFGGVWRATKPTEVTMQRCQCCGNMKMTKLVGLYRNTGMLFRRETTSLVAYLCRSCIHRKFWEFEFKNVIFGPWGMISVIAAIIYFFQNIFVYVTALYKLRDALE
jgi:hypothetical protein